MVIRSSSNYPLCVDYSEVSCLYPPLPQTALCTSKQGKMEKDRKKEAGKGLVRQFAAAPKRRVSKSTEQGSLFSPFSPSPLFKLVSGAFSLPGQNPDSVPCTREGIITSVSLGETGLLSAGRSLMWKHKDLSAAYA